MFKIFILLTAILISQATWAKSYVIFSMTQDLAMGHENEVIRKNYYINLGTGQGVRKDSIIDVYRIISVQNPYDNKQRVNYKTKIGELKVIHTSDDASIAMVNKYEIENAPIFELPLFMIGDHVAIHLN